jgi:hypothetical protein
MNSLGRAYASKHDEGATKCSDQETQEVTLTYTSLRRPVEHTAAFRRKSRSIVTVFNSHRSRLFSARSSLVSGPCGSALMSALRF